VGRRGGSFGAFTVDDTFDSLADRVMPMARAAAKRAKSLLGALTGGAEVARTALFGGPDRRWLRSAIGLAPSCLRFGAGVWSAMRAAGAL